MISLDYTLYTDKQRLEYIKHKLQGVDQSEISPLAAQRMADYILFGKDAQKGTNAVQRKEISKPVTAYSTFARRPDESLEKLAEEGVLESKQADANLRNVYTHPKPTIEHHYTSQGSALAPTCVHAAACPFAPSCRQADAEKAWRCDAWIPGMAELWDSIKQVEESRDAEKDAAKQYHIKHWLAQLRQQQYVLKEGYRPTIPNFFGGGSANKIDWEHDCGVWRGCAKPGEEAQYSKIETQERADGHDYYKHGDSLWRSRDGVWEEYIVKYRHKIDLTNPEHIYHLLNNYRSLLKHCYDDLNGQMKWILKDLDAIAERTYLSDIQTDILNYRVLNWANERIANKIEQDYHHTYNPNYISIVFKSHVCHKIAATAALMQREIDARNKPEMWKKCSCCGELLLLDEANFVHKTISKDGYSARCKRCDSRIRLQRQSKEKENGK